MSKGQFELANANPAGERDHPINFNDQPPMWVSIGGKAPWVAVVFVYNGDI